MPDRILEGKTVLLVEDEMLIALDIADTLTAAGAHIIGPCTSLEDASAAALNASIDLALLDIDLHGEEVFPAAKLLRTRGIPFAFHTGQPEREALRTEFASAPVCVKPLTAERLVSARAGIMATAA